MATQGLVLPLPARLPVADLDPSRLPQPSPLEGPYAPNAKLRAARRLYEGRVQGSGGSVEAVAGRGRSPPAVHAHCAGSGRRY